MLALLKSPRTIGIAIGSLAMIGLALSWYIRGLQIETLKAKLESCSSQRDEIAANAEALVRTIDARNTEIARQAAEFELSQKRQRELTLNAEHRATELSAELANRLSAIDRTAIPESTVERIEQCERARSLLVR